MLKKNQIRKILVIRRDNIGDLVCTTPAIAALRQHYPAAQIGVLVNSYNANVLIGNPNVDHCFVYQKLKHAGGPINKCKALAHRLKLIIQLRCWQPDVTILAKSSEDRHGLNFARQIGAKNIIGFVPDDLNRAQGLPDIAIAKPEAQAVHEVEAINRLLSPLGIDDALGPLQVFPDPNTEALLKKRLPEAGRRIALHISAREAERRWGLDNFIAFTDYILETDADNQILLFWSPGNADDPHHPGDDAMASQLIETIPSQRLIPMPTRDLKALVAAVSLCDLFIGTDGGAMHLAAALDKKVLAMFENTPYKLNHWYPWLVAHQLVHSEHAHQREVGFITQEQMRQAFNRLTDIAKNGFGADRPSVLRVLQ